MQQLIGNDNSRCFIWCQMCASPYLLCYNTKTNRYIRFMKCASWHSANYSFSACRITCKEHVNQDSYTSYKTKHIFLTQKGEKP
ncbi:hypothetical protein FKM82_003020 [Ascaphus truei]